MPSFGVLGIGGMVALAFGGLLLTTSNDPRYEVDPWLAFGMPATLGVAVAALAVFVFSTRSRAVAASANVLEGAIGVARSPLAPSGTVMVRGERWRAVASSPIAEGERVVVTGVRGLELEVRAEDGAEDEPGGVTPAR